MNGSAAVQSLMAFAALTLVLLLILAIAYLARRLPALRRAAAPAGPMRVLASLALDRTHRMHLLEIGGQQALVLTGGSGGITMLRLDP